jgi:hypothetical protein
MLEYPHRSTVANLFSSRGSIMPKGGKLVVVLTAVLPALVSLFIAFIMSDPAVAAAQTPDGQILLLNRRGTFTTRLTDGDLIKLRLRLKNQTSQAVQASFYFDDPQSPLGTCTIAAGQEQCETDLLPALGWYWGADGTPQTNRRILVDLDGVQAQTDLWRVCEWPGAAVPDAQLRRRRAVCPRHRAGVPA